MLVTQDREVYLQNRARSLTGLMDLYESNYMRLCKLIPDIAALDGFAISSVSQSLQLHVRIIECCKYTTTLNLTYFFCENNRCTPQPDIKVRMYSDARLAEVISCGKRRGKRAAEYDRMRQQYPLLRRWEMNRFLQKWLGYLLHQGHSFAPIEPQSDALQFVEMNCPERLVDQS